MKLRTSNDPKLRAVNKEVRKITPDIKALMSEMLRITAASGGVGIAAPQIGVNKKVALVWPSFDGPHLFLFNPVIINHSEEVVDSQEGCLSLPGKLVSVPRFTEVTVRYMNRLWETKEKVFTGLEAIIVQHEIDHLEGILIRM